MAATYLQQQMQALLSDTATEQGGPTPPAPGEVLEVLQTASTLGFSIFSSIYGAVTAINAQTAQLDTASGTVAAEAAGSITVTPPASLGGGRAASTNFQVQEPGPGWKEPDWLTPVNIALGVGGIVLIAMVARR